jgi:hypothetical protein
MRKPELIGLLRQSLVDFDALSADDQGALTYRYLLPILLHTVGTFLAAQDGLVEEKYADLWVTNLASMVKCRGLKDSWWPTMKVLLHPDFSAEVEQLIESPNGPPSYDELVPWLASNSVTR